MLITSYLAGPLQLVLAVSYHLPQLLVFVHPRLETLGETAGLLENATFRTIASLISILTLSLA